MNQRLSPFRDRHSECLPSRSHTTVVLAMTADGKIADTQRTAARFGSENDKLHLEQQIALVDGVLFGAGTLRAYGATLMIANPELLAARQKRSQPLQPINIVVSASGKIDPHLRFFDQPVPRWLLTTNIGARIWQGKTQFERIFCFNSTHEPNSGKHWSEFLAKFHQLGIEKLAILGGGKLVASLFAADLIDELWLTVCPLILGGSNAPTPVSGIGFPQSQGRKLNLLEVKQIDQEVFLHYSVRSNI